MNELKPIKKGIDIIDNNSCDVRGRMVGIASNTCCGRTTKLIQAMVQSLKNDRNILIFLNEITKEDFLLKLISSYYGISVDRLDYDKNEYNSDIEKDFYKDLIAKFFNTHLLQINFVPTLLNRNGISITNIKSYVTSNRVDDIFIDNFTASIPKLKNTENKKDCTSFTMDLNRLAQNYGLTVYATLLLRFSAIDKEIEDIECNDLHLLDPSAIHCFSFIEVLKRRKKFNSHIDSMFLKSRNGIKTKYTYDNIKFYKGDFGEIKEIKEEDRPVNFSCCLPF